MGLFKSKSEDQWKINYIKEFNENLFRRIKEV